MNIISIEPNPSGAYQSPQSWNEENAPEGYIEITADTTEFFNGFIIPTIENGKMTSYICNTEAWEAWKDSLSPVKPPEPTTEEKLRADVDYLAMVTGVSL